MKDDFPLVPFVLMALTISGCTTIGYLTGIDGGNIVGLGIGLVLGIVVFGVLSNLPANPSFGESRWRQDEPHSLLQGPRQWVSRIMESLGMRRR